MHMRLSEVLSFAVSSNAPSVQLTYKIKDPQSRARFFSALGREDEAAAALQAPQQVEDITSELRIYW